MLIDHNCGDRYHPGEERTGPSLGVAVGDLTGDGMDEVVLAALDKVHVYQLNGEMLEDKASVSRLWPRLDPARRVVEVTDLDATADAAEWRPEIVVQDWGAASNKQRIRVFQATTNGAGVITSLVPRGELAEPQVSMSGGDVVLTCGDFDGDALRLGAPTGPLTITDAVHPSVILGAPPVHFDVFEQPYDLTDCYPGGSTYACDPDFQAVYSRETSQDYAVETQISSDWGLSAELKGSVEGYGAKIEARMKGTYGEHFGRTGSQSHTYTVSEYTITDGVDRILADAMTYTLWEYPVMSGVGNVVGHIAVMEPASTSPTTQWFTYDSWAALTGAQAPVITHEPGNILSYSKLVPETGEYGERWKAELSGWEVGQPVAAMAAAQDCAAPHCFDLWWSDISGGSVETSWEAGFEVGLTASYEAGDPLGEMKAGISASVEGTYSASEMATHSVSIGQDIHLGATLGNLGGAAEAPYTVSPYVYRSATSGTLVLDYKVMPAGVVAENWWNRYLHAPDLTFMLPRLHREEKGFPLEDPTTKYRSPDVRLMPDRVAVGDTVTIRATVRNYSLMDWGQPATVRFFVGDPEGEHTPIYDVQGQTVFTTSGGIPSREGRPVTIQWVVPMATPDLVRVYAQVDPDSVVAEVHEYNNKAYALLYATGGAVDVPAAAAGVPFRLEQSAPNPFRGSTMIAFGLPERARVELKVYDIAGRVVATLVETDLPAGRHEYRWDGRGRNGDPVPLGVYLCRLRAGTHREVRRMVRLD
jgi:hypothetical protein